MPRPPSWLRVVAASKGEAALAVKLYNEPHLSRALEGFVVHMHMAWLYLLQAEFLRAGVDFRFPHPHHRGWFDKIDGEFKIWDLVKCIRERWPEGGAVRSNLEFFVQLRNKVEHRYAVGDEALFSVVSSKSHAMLLNYEEELTSKFGTDQSMAHDLRFPVFVGTFTEPAEDVLIRLQRSLPADLHRFLAEYDAGVSDEVRGDSRYSLRLRVLLDAVTSKSDMAIQFDRYEELTDEAKAAVDELGRQGRVIVRQQDRPVQHQGMLKAGAVMAEVAARIPFKFNSYDFSQAWRIGNVRPGTGAKDPKRTKKDFCIFDAVHKDYIYTQAYVDHLVKKCSTEAGFLATTGRLAKPK